MNYTFFHIENIQLKTEDLNFICSLYFDFQEKSVKLFMSF